MSRLSIFALLTLLAVAVGPARAQDLDKGKEAVWQGDYAAALAELRPLAEEGDAEAQYNLANLYRDGRGVPRDDEKAADWYNRAAEGGSWWAAFDLGMLYWGQDLASGPKDGAPNDTLIRVARSIVDRQEDFLEKGEEAMKPMILRDVAEEVGMHESTISRATTAKYMHTPRGVFEFRFFFSSHVSNEEGTEVSSTAIRARIKRMIGDEEARKPLSDSVIARRLADEGIKVARRTVAKYREGMGLPASSERRREAARTGA